MSSSSSENVPEVSKSKKSHMRDMGNATYQSQNALTEDVNNETEEVSVDELFSTDWGKRKRTASNAALRSQETEMAMNAKKKTSKQRGRLVPIPTKGTSPLKMAAKAAKAVQAAKLINVVFVSEVAASSKQNKGGKRKEGWKYDRQ